MRYVVFACALLLLVGCAAPQETGPDPAEVRQAIDAVNSEFAEAFSNHDAETVAGLYTEDAVYMPQGAPAVHGREAIQQAMQAEFETTGPSDMVLTTESIEFHGDAVVEVGAFSLTLTPPGQEEAIQDEGKYIVVWKQNEGGMWRLHIDIWNTNSMPAMEEAEGESEE